MKQFLFSMRLLPRFALPAFLFLAVALGAAIPFPQVGSDLKPDPAARFGTLPNGLRYVVRPNKEPKDRASLRLLVEAGSLHETDDQRGLAHYLEHLAFAGSEHYPPGTLVEFFQRMGMSFGGDTNASTGYDRTLYLLELPDTKPATLAEGLRVFGDYAGGLLLEPASVEKERAIILSEMRTSDSVGRRTQRATTGFLLAGTRFPEREPIGITSVIEQAPRDRFLAFWKTWYRPDLMSVVVVGDIDPVAVEQQIVAAFAKLTAEGPAPAKPDLGRLNPAQGVRTLHHHEPEAPATSVMIATVSPHIAERDTAANRVKDVPRNLAHAIISRRLSILAKKENAPFSSGGAGAWEEYKFYRQSALGLTCKAAQWSAALGVADQELRRALEHGFQPAELKEIVARQINGLEQAVKTAATRPSEALAGEIAQSLLDRDVFTSPEDDLALFKPVLEKATVEDCLTALRTAWSAPHRLVLVTGNANPGTDAGAVIASTYEKSRAVAVTPPEAIADAKWAYTDFGPPGKVVRREHVADLDLTLLTFENGVRLNLKKTDFEANRIRVSVRVGTGQLTEPRDQPGLASFTNQTFTAGGLGRHSADDLRRILAGRTVGAGFGAGGDAFVLGGGTNREDLLLELQLITAHVTDPGYRPEAARQAAKSIEQMYLSFEHTAGGPFTLEVPRLLASGDHRFGLPPKDEMLRRNLDEVKAWVGPQLARGALEIALVGDLDVEATIAAVARTLGALPPRVARPAHDDLRHVRFPAEPLVRDYTIASEIPKGAIRAFWPTTDGFESRPSRQISPLRGRFGKLGCQLSWQPKHETNRVCRQPV
jgi:zinc protease